MKVGPQERVRATDYLIHIILSGNSDCFNTHVMCQGPCQRTNREKSEKQYISEKILIFAFLLNILVEDIKKPPHALNSSY